MENKKICPMTGKKCATKDCGWYSEKFDECAVHSLGESMTYLMTMGDDRGIKVDIDKEEW